MGEWHALPIVLEFRTSSVSYENLLGLAHKLLKGNHSRWSQPTSSILPIACQAGKGLTWITRYGPSLCTRCKNHRPRAAPAPGAETRSAGRSLATNSSQGDSRPIGRRKNNKGGGTTMSTICGKVVGRTSSWKGFPRLFHRDINVFPCESVNQDCTSWPIHKDL